MDITDVIKDDSQTVPISIRTKKEIKDFLDKHRIDKRKLFEKAFYELKRDMEEDIGIN